MVIGIVGGVGSGKSTALGILRENYHAYICMADELGHEAMRRGTEAYEKILRTFGEEICGAEGEIDRGALAQRVYGDREQLEQLNGIIHPYVKAEIGRRIAASPEEQFFVLETAILFETGCDELCDEVWGVITENETRIRRLMDSRGYSREKAESIMKNQMDNIELTKRCDRIIVNDGDEKELICQIQTCVENLLENRN